MPFRNASNFLAKTHLLLAVLDETLPSLALLTIQALGINNVRTGLAFASPNSAGRKVFDQSLVPISSGDRHLGRTNATKFSDVGSFTCTIEKIVFHEVVWEPRSARDSSAAASLHNSSAAKTPTNGVSPSLAYASESSPLHNELPSELPFGQASLSSPVSFSSSYCPHFSPRRGHNRCWHTGQELEKQNPCRAFLLLQSNGI